MKMNRCALANQYHTQGFNCSQSVLMAFADLTGLSLQKSMDVGAGLGGGCINGELCGAISGSLMVLGLLTPVDPKDPVASKQRTAVIGKDFQTRFVEKFGAVRCADLKRIRLAVDDNTPAARELGVANHCGILIVTAVELIEQILDEKK